MTSNPDAINKLQGSDPTTSQHPQQGTSYTSPTNVEYTEPPPSIQRRPQNLPKPTLPSNTQHLQGPPTPQADPTAAPRLRIPIPSRNRRQTQQKPKPRHELINPLDPYRLTTSPIDAVRSFITQMGDWAMQGLPNQEGRVPQGAEHELESGLRPQPRLTGASIRAETEQLHEQLKGRRIPRRVGSWCDGATHFPARTASLPNLPEILLPQHNVTLYPPGYASNNLEEGPPSRPWAPEKATSRPSSKSSRKGDSERMEMNGGGNIVLDPSPPATCTSPASEPAPHHTPPLSRISPLRLASQLPGIPYPDNTKPDHPLPVYWRLIVRQIYRHLLLRLPSFYFNRVVGVFQEARISKPDLELLIPRPTNTPLGLRGAEASRATLVNAGPPGRQWPRSLERFKEEWEYFVIGLIDEWKTLNILSALLLATLFTVLQIQDVAQNVVTRTMALLTLISALMSLIFGSMYIVWFSVMRPMRKAAQLAEESMSLTTNIFWNVWVFLALPACWLAWSFVFFCVTVICFIWTSGDNGTLETPVTPLLDSASSNPGGDHRPAPGVTLGLRVVETLFFVVGFVHFVMVIRTFRVWRTIGTTPLRAGESQDPDIHRLKEDTPPPARHVPGGTGQGLRFVVEPKERESSQRLQPTDQRTDTDEKHYGRSSEDQDTAPVQVIVSKDEMHWEKERERLYGTVSSEDNLPDDGEKTGYVGALDFEPGRITEGSSGGDILLRSIDATSPPKSALGSSTHD